jgi:hypothetical protein
MPTAKVGSSLPSTHAAPTSTGEKCFPTQTLARANICSACPVTAGKPIRAAGIIPVNQNDVAGIPPIALYIPDFEGQAILRIFSNSTQAEIGCFASQITNGNSFRQKDSVGGILGAFTLIAILSSSATAIYGDDIAEMRSHYAHSLSVMVVFAVWHHIYFTGALSMNWPNVLVSFWSNYAWTGGIIYSEHMQNMINEFIGSNKGNTSQVGAAGTGVNNPGLGGGYNIQAIYKRSSDDPTQGFVFTGQPVKPGLPLPGNFSGFSGTLAQDRIPASNAFMTSLLWSLAFLAFVIACILTLKLLLEGLSRSKIMKKDRLAFFRTHYIRYIICTVLRASFVGFFLMAFTSMFQFSYLKSPGPVAVSCAIFLLVVFGIGTAAGLACYRRLRDGIYICEQDPLSIEKIKLSRIIPWWKISRESKCPRSEDKAYVGSIPWWTFEAACEKKSVHDDEAFIKSFGWLASRYRRTRWWFFAVWLVYEFIRACFLAGASGQPFVQVFGLLAVECLAFVVMICLRPFEGQRLNVLLIYFLGFSKVATTALAATLDTHFNLPRILATVVGIIIIVIQGLLTTAVLVAILVGVVTSYFSIMRNRDEIRPRGWLPMRESYFKRLNLQNDEDPPRPQRMQVAHRGTYFSVNQVKRVAKVEDEDQEFVQELLRNKPSMSRVSIISTSHTASETSSQRSRALIDVSQVSYTTLPRAARLHRPNWTSRSFHNARGAGRARAASNTIASSLELSELSRDRATSHADSTESLNRQPSSLRMASRATAPAYEAIPHPFEDDQGSVPFRQCGSRPNIRSRSSSRPPLEGRISEENIPPIPRKSSIRMLAKTEEIK